MKMWFRRKSGYRQECLHQKLMVHSYKMNRRKVANVGDVNGVNGVSVSDVSDVNVSNSSILRRLVIYASPTRRSNFVLKVLGASIARSISPSSTSSAPPPIPVHHSPPPDFHNPTSRFHSPTSFPLARDFSPSAHFPSCSASHFSSHFLYRPSVSSVSIESTALVAPELSSGVQHPDPPRGNRYPVSLCADRAVLSNFFHPCACCIRLLSRCSAIYHSALSR
ncbi:hypothetical protein RSOLAG1IB_09573 [Rhizoctonia solani AG-1 IB]|uniref:Uncharacterized protein n=1 Tax=Thanatephorus cucumeris (strain AG1-IB / isolate 7/3/14) TaxID=1108050 RepID=A0A0B7FRP1_THACB|nr:hypothetical protein RSOLAG1IB_09573 [Rhizoctonia solani AG-1 IB]